MEQIMLNNELTMCERRGLWIRPGLDCRHCAWYECEKHPAHVLWPKVQKVLSQCPTRKRSRPDCKGKKKVWDGKQEYCMRHNWRKGNPGYGDACENCTLTRPCKYRGEQGAWLGKKVRKKQKQKRWEDGMYYITKDRNRFVVRLQINGKQTTIGRYDTPEEAKTARDAALLKLDGKQVDGGAEH